MSLHAVASIIPESNGILSLPCITLSDQEHPVFHAVQALLSLNTGHLTNEPTENRNQSRGVVGATVYMCIPCEGPYTFFFPTDESSNSEMVYTLSYSP